MLNNKKELLAILLLSIIISSILLNKNESFQLPHSKKLHKHH